MPNLISFVRILIGLLRPLTLLVASLSLLAFFWGLARFIMKAGDTKAHAEGKNLMIWGTIALFVMVSVWGILRFFQGELGLGTLAIPQLPSP